jgi:hypothetical protein
MSRQAFEGTHKVVATAAAKAIRDSAAKAAREQIHNLVGIGFAYLSASDPVRSH